MIMKTPALPAGLLGVALLSLLAIAPVARAQSTIDPANVFAWSGNLGWLNWRPSVADGALTGEYVCSGSVWAANAGWISLGSGTPANGIRYQNNSATDFGVNLLADGSLRGLAWGANIGWVNFEATGNPRIDFATGILRGYAWAANAGWITLDDGGSHFVATTQIAPGVDTNANGIPDAWELERAGNLTTFTLNGDADGDGIPDVAEYLADTDPLNPADTGLRITAFALSADTTLVSLTWTSRLSRRYHIESSDALAGGVWTESALAEIAPDSDATTMRELTEPAATQRFYRIRVARPLAP